MSGDASKRIGVIMTRMTRLDNVPLFLIKVTSSEANMRRSGTM